jgi:hypothetical protein
MTRLFMEDGKQIPVTVLQLDKLQVVAQRTADAHGYSAVQLGAGTAKAKRVSAPMRGHFAKAKRRAQAQGRGVPRGPREPDRTWVRKSSPTITSKVSSWTCPAPRSVRALPVP